MAVRNPSWYDLNEQRSWPLDELATHISDSGDRIPYDLLVDMNMQFPNKMGTYAFVSSITVGPKTASLTIASDMGVPLASISIVNPEKWIHYPLDVNYPGIGGWVVFGTGINQLSEPVSFRFAGIDSGKLMPKLARSYLPRPVAGIGKKNVEEFLSGIVKLDGGNDIEVVKESREISGRVVDAIVVRLKDKVGGTEIRNVFADYVGECGTRPESQNCNGNLPIEYINSVQPDCFGNIIMEFRGCADITIDESGCGILVDCNLGLSEACVTADHLPDETGKLPNEYDDLCVDVSISVVVDEDTALSGFVNLLYEPEDCAANQMSSLPYTADFVSGSIPAEFTMIQGTSEIQFDNQPASFGGMSLVFNASNTNASFNTNKGHGAVGIFNTGAATATVTITSYTELNSGDKVNLIATDGTNYDFVNGDQSSVNGTWESTTSNNQTAENLMNVINTSSGPSGTRFSATVSGPVVTITQSSGGEDGNTAVTLTDSGTAGMSKTNFTGFTDSAWRSICRSIDAWLVIKEGLGVGVQRNAGVIFNYRSSPTIIGGREYWMAYLDWNTKSFEIRHFHGAGYDFLTSVPFLNIKINLQYHVYIEVFEAANETAWVTATLTNSLPSTDPDYVNTTIGPFLVDNYGPYTGHVGFLANRSEADLNKIIIDNATP